MPNISNDGIDFEIQYPLNPVLSEQDNPYSSHCPNLYYHDSGWLIAYPIEIFLRPEVANLEKATKMLKEEAEKFGVKPFRNFWYGNCSFLIGLETKNPTQVEIVKIYGAFKHLKDIKWPGGMDVHQNRKSE